MITVVEKRMPRARTSINAAIASERITSTPIPVEISNLQATNHGAVLGHHVDSRESAWTPPSATSDPITSRNAVLHASGKSKISWAGILEAAGG